MSVGASAVSQALLSGASLNGSEGSSGHGSSDGRSVPRFPGMPARRLLLRPGPPAEPGPVEALGPEPAPGPAGGLPARRRRAADAAFTGGAGAAFCGAAFLGAAFPGAAPAGAAVFAGEASWPVAAFGPSGPPGRPVDLLGPAAAVAPWAVVRAGTVWWGASTGRSGGAWPKAFSVPAGSAAGDGPAAPAVAAPAAAAARGHAAPEAALPEAALPEAVMPGPGLPAAAPSEAAGAGRAA